MKSKSPPSARASTQEERDAFFKRQAARGKPSREHIEPVDPHAQAKSIGLEALAKMKWPTDLLDGLPGWKDRIVVALWAIHRAWWLDSVVRVIDVGGGNWAEVISISDNLLFNSEGFFDLWGLCAKHIQDPSVLRELSCIWFVHYILLVELDRRSRGYLAKGADLVSRIREKRGNPYTSLGNLQFRGMPLWKMYLMPEETYWQHRFRLMAAFERVWDQVKRAGAPTRVGCFPGPLCRLRPDPVPEWDQGLGKLITNEIVQQSLRLVGEARVGQRIPLKIKDILRAPIRPTGERALIRYILRQAAKKPTQDQTPRERQIVQDLQQLGQEDQPFIRAKRKENIRPDPQVPHVHTQTPRPQTRHLKLPCIPFSKITVNPKSKEGASPLTFEQVLKIAGEIDPRLPIALTAMEHGANRLDAANLAKIPARTFDRQQQKLKAHLLLQRP